MSILSGARKVVINNSQLTNHVPDGSKGVGLEKLRMSSVPGVAHDSSERYPPPICHPGTRKGHIKRLTQWGLNSSNHLDRIAWVKGPAGVGKSAVAQSCAEALGDKLGASFFFSRSNHRDDPNRFFTSLAYQLAVKHDAYGAYLDRQIGRDPTVVRKSLPHQFKNLFVIPFAQPAIEEEVGERVIIVDGLDECARKEAQVDIIQIVATSVREGTTPFLWIFLSRLEPKIVATFDLPDVTSISQQIDLPVSRNIDKEILLYLADKLREIGREHHFALPWPSEREVWALVDFSAGLFACAHAIVYFISAESPAGPVEHLRAVLRLAKRSATKSRDSHPLSALDDLYTLVMERIPPAMLQTVQWILLATRVGSGNYGYQSANLSGLSELQFRNGCRCLHSVMMIETNDDARITFYHASFMDFIEDPARSRRFCIWSDCAVTLLEEVSRHLDQVQVDVDDYNGSFIPRLNLTWPSANQSQLNCYTDHVSAFVRLLSSVYLGDGTRNLGALTDFDFRKIALVRSRVGHYTVVEVENLMQKLDSRLGLLRPSILWNLRASFPFISEFSKHYYTIGLGKKRALLEVTQYGSYVRPYWSWSSKIWAKRLYKESERSKEILLVKGSGVAESAMPDWTPTHRRRVFDAQLQNVDR